MFLIFLFDLYPIWNTAIIDARENVRKFRIMYREQVSV